VLSRSASRVLDARPHDLSRVTALSSSLPPAAQPTGRAAWGVSVGSTPLIGSIDRRALWWAIVVTLLTTLFGILARFQIMLGGLARPVKANIFLRLFALHEQPFLLLLFFFAVFTALATRYRSAHSKPGWARVRSLTPPSTLALAIVASLVLVVTLAATFGVMHSLLFSMDEFGADFQARLFASGRMAYALPDDWRPLGRAITPIFVAYRQDTGSWYSAYLPVYALLKTPFVALGASELLNPLLAALAVLTLGAVARRLWPEDGSRPWLAVALLVTSGQFLATSATGYAMPAHLLLNLLWLLLYLRGDARSWAAALVIGVFALGLHSPFPHALFVAPFLVRLLRDKRWKRLGAAALAYGVGGALWLGWLRLIYAGTPVQASGLLSVFAIPSPIIIWVNGLSFSLLFTWQAPLFGLLVVLAVLRARRLSAPLADLAWGVLLTLGFFLFFPATQGHGWGHRYAYQLLGSLALLAAAGADPLISALGERKAQLLIAASLLAAILVQLPLRALQTERFVRPFAEGYRYVTTRPAAVVIVHGNSIWYGQDLLRNDPLLRGQPVVVSAGMLTAAQRATLERKYEGHIVDVSDAELVRLGMSRQIRAQR
jgi:hypothetical protein